MRLARYHGLGNDYLVLEEGPPLTPELARAVCDRHTGVGGDGILEPFEPTDADHGVTIWNPDGSRAEKSGNGLRIFARWLVDTGRAGRAFTVSTGPCRVACEVRDDAVAVEMGRASLAPSDVPVQGRGPRVEAPLDLGGETVAVTAVGVGNPHAVIFVDDVEQAPWRRWGEALERHRAFPNRTNVQVAQVRGPRTLEIRIWERGAGPTLASGSSSCAVAAAAVHTGRIEPGPVVVHMPGGTLHVDVSPVLDLVLVGPVERIGGFDVDPAWLEARGGRT